MPTHPCPKCGRLLKQAGEVMVVGNGPYPVFQCDDCIIEGEVFGEKFPMAYTFVLDEQQRIIDPDTGQPTLNGST